MTSLRSAKSHRLRIPQIWSCNWQRQGWMMGVRKQWWKEQAAAQFKQRIQLLGYGKKILVTKNRICIHPHQPGKLFKIGSVSSWWWMLIYCSLPLEGVVYTVVQLWLFLLKIHSFHVHSAMCMVNSLQLHTPLSFQGRSKYIGRYLSKDFRIDRVLWCINLIEIPGLDL